MFMRGPEVYVCPKPEGKMTTSLQELQKRREQAENEIAKVVRGDDDKHLAGLLIISVFEVAEQIAALKESLDGVTR